jgi:hypothetical protein
VKFVPESLTIYCRTVFDHFLQDLTGQVTILTYPNQKYAWIIGEGSFSNVVKGEWRKKGAAENDPPVSISLPTELLIIR